MDSPHKEPTAQKMFSFDDVMTDQGSKQTNSLAIVGDDNSHSTEDIEHG